ncbi:MAG: sodium-dependent bicarbonate transport family permease [Rhodocyclaceae bacterium]|nr:sodium-dependent bicarbonate transport family permease [Rhodocyclaceae bacterium]
MSFDPALLFFAFGAAAGFVKSNLEIPQQIGKFLSLYLLMALGLEAGFAMAESGLTPDIAISLGAAVAMAFVVPALGYALLRPHINTFDAAAVAAAYGSVSAVTFVTATHYLEGLGMAPGGHMTLAMVLMESPAILMAVALSSMLRARLPGTRQATHGVSLRHILHESFTDGAHLLVLGATVIGVISGDAGKVVMEPFAGELFKGMLAFFLLDMGLLVARNFKEGSRASRVLVTYAALAPPVHAALALGLAWLLAMPVVDTALLMVLSASASYIVVPATLRYAIPEANPSIYFGLPLGISLPVNLLVGIPLYVELAGRIGS